MTDSTRLSAAVTDNPILAYWGMIQDGSVIVPAKIRKTYAKIVRDLDDTTSPYYYSPARAEHVLYFVQRYCRHSKGKMGGQPVALEPWQQAMLATIFGFVDIEGRRKYRVAILIIGKKNGKSLLASAIGLYLLTADGEAGPEIYSVATKKDQAKIIWSESKRMRNKSPALRKRTRALVAEIACDGNDGSYKALASDVDTMDGLNVHGALMDEIHAWINGRALYDIVADGVAAREQPLIMITTTAGFVREDFYDEKYDEITRLINGYEDPDGYHDDRLISFCYELDDRSEWTDPAMWQKANPGLGTIKNLRTLQEKVGRAKANPNMVKNLLCKEFNVRETETGSWLSFDEINDTRTFDIRKMRDCYAIGGADLSSTTDLTCATLLIEKAGQIYIGQMYFIPEDIIEQKIREDKVPYDAWIQRGLVTACPGSRIDYSMVTAWFVSMRDEHGIYPLWIGYDSWGSQYWKTEMESNGFVMEEVRQGAQTMSGPMKIMASDLRSHMIIYDNNPCLKWCLTNCQVKQDDNQNIRPVKGRNNKRRIDGAVAMIDAYVIFHRHLDDYRAMQNND